MVTLDDLAAAVRARLEAAPGFAAALPGGAWPDRGPDDAPAAYATFALEPAGDPEWFSDGSYLQGYTLRATAYAVQGLPGQPTAQEAQLALAAALNPDPTGWPPLRAGRVTLCLPRPFDGARPEQRLRGGRDVLAAAGQWALTIEGTR